MLLRPSSGFTQLPRSVACFRSTWQLSCARICVVGESRTSHRGRPLHAPAAASGGLRAGCGAAGGRVGCKGLEEATGIRRRPAGAWSPLCFFPSVTLVRPFDFSGPGVFTCEREWWFLPQRVVRLRGNVGETAASARGRCSLAVW